MQRYGRVNSGISHKLSEWLEVTGHRIVNVQKKERGRGTQKGVITYGLESGPSVHGEKDQILR